MNKLRSNSILPKKAVEEFKILYKAKFSRDLTAAEATKRANNLFSLYQAVYGFSSNKQKTD